MVTITVTDQLCTCDKGREADLQSVSFRKDLVLLPCLPWLPKYLGKKNLQLSSPSLEISGQKLMRAYTRVGCLALLCSVGMPFHSIRHPVIHREEMILILGDAFGQNSGFLREKPMTIT